MIVLYGNICRKPNIMWAKSKISSRFSFITTHRVCFKDDLPWQVAAKQAARWHSFIFTTSVYIIYVRKLLVCETFNCTGYTVTDSTMDYQYIYHILMLFFDGFSQRFPRKFSHGMRCLLSKAWWRDWRRLRPWQMRRKNPWEHRMRTAARFLIWRCWWLFLLMLYGFSPWKSYCFEMFYGFSPVLKISGIFVSRLFGWDLKKYVCVCLCVWFKFKTHGTRPSNKNCMEGADRNCKTPQLWLARLLLQVPCTRLHD